MDIFGYILIALLIATVLSLIGTLVGFDVVEHFRRLKHPKWYEYFDRAKKNSFSIGSRLNDEIDTINKCIIAMREAYRKGELTEKSFRGVMEVYTNDYIKAVNKYNEDYVALKIDEDIQAADAYAKEHKWKYGILYPDTKL